MSDEHILSIALPAKGRLYDGVRTLLDRCGLKLRRESERQYHASLEGVRYSMTVTLRRAKDITKLVSRGEADFGITGFDLFCESGGEDDPNLVMVFDELDFGECELLIAVPDHWAHVSSISDLAELAALRKASQYGGPLRIATEFPNLTRAFLLERGITYFSIVQVTGAAESAPNMGAADLIADLKTSGITLIENRLKAIGGGQIRVSRACLFACRNALLKSERKLIAARYLVDRVESYLRGKGFYMITANVYGDSEKDVAARILIPVSPGASGAKGPTIGKVWTLCDGEAVQNMFSVTIICDRRDIEDVVSHLRDTTGATDILVSNISFVYNAEPLQFMELKQRLLHSE